MSFQDLEEFIQVQNKKLKPSNRYLCATALNGYDVMMVGVEKSLGHKNPSFLPMQNFASLELRLTAYFLIQLILIGDMSDLSLR